MREKMRVHMTSISMSANGSSAIGKYRYGSFGMKHTAGSLRIPEKGNTNVQEAIKMPFVENVQSRLSIPIASHMSLPLHSSSVRSKNVGMSSMKINRTHWEYCIHSVEARVRT